MKNINNDKREMSLCVRARGEKTDIKQKKKKKNAYDRYETARYTTMVLRRTTATTEGGCTAAAAAIIIIISAARDVGRSRLLTTEEVQGRGGARGHYPKGKTVGADSDDQSAAGNRLPTSRPIAVAAALISRAGQRDDKKNKKT